MKEIQDSENQIDLYMNIFGYRFVSQYKCKQCTIRSSKSSYGQL